MFYAAYQCFSNSLWIMGCLYCLHRILMHDFGIICNMCCYWTLFLPWIVSLYISALVWYHLVRFDFWVCFDLDLFIWIWYVVKMSFCFAFISFYVWIHSCIICVYWTLLCWICVLWAISEIYICEMELLELMFEFFILSSVCTCHIFRGSMYPVLAY